MDALGWAVLILVLAAAVIRLIAHPLVATLGTCFASWAEQSRTEDDR